MKWGVAVAAAGAVWLAGAVWVLAQGEAAKSPWETTVAAGASLSRGNSENTLLNGSVLSLYKADPNELRLGAEYNYGEAETMQEDGSKETDTNVENSKAYAQYKRLLSERIYAYGNGEALTDDMAGIDYRYVIGPGLGYFLLKGELQTLGVEAGPSYLLEKLDGRDADNDLVLRVAERYDLKVGATSKVWESVEGLFSAEDLSEYLVNAEVGVEAAMNSTLSLRVVGQDKYNSEPPAGRDRNDMTMIASLVWKL